MTSFAHSTFSHLHVSHYEALDAEIASIPMPAEYADKMVKILCNDCLQKSVTKWHICGLRWTSHCFCFTIDQSQTIDKGFFSAPAVHIEKS